MKKAFFSICFVCIFLMAGCSVQAKNESVQPSFDLKYKTYAYAYEIEYKVEENALYARGKNNLNFFDVEEGALQAQWMKLAENVVHVDATGSAVIYLTENGELYGMGELTGGVLQTEDISDFALDNIIAEPKLLMTNCKYAAIGIRFAVAVKEDNTLWFWGESLNGQSTEVFEKTLEPIRIAENIQFADAFLYTTAWVDEKGDLYLVGDNSFGQIGNGHKGSGFPTLYEDIVTTPYCALKNCTAFTVVDKNYGIVQATDADGAIYEWGNNQNTTPARV